MKPKEPEVKSLTTNAIPLQLDKPLLTTKEAAQVLNRQEQTLWIWSCRGTGPGGLQPVRINGRLGWRTADIKRLVEGVS